MKVLVLGAGEVGFHLAKRLSEENQDVILIESDPERADFASQQLDILTVVGNGASLPVLEKAGISDANMLLSVTSKDEVNLSASMAAKKFGVQRVVRSPGFVVFPFLPLARGFPRQAILLQLPLGLRRMLRELGSLPLEIILSDSALVDVVLELLRAAGQLLLGRA